MHEIYRRVYEGVPFGKLALLARGLSKVARYDGGRLTVTELDAERLRRVGGRGELLGGRHRPPARGRGHRGRRADPRADLRTTDGAPRKVSLRASDERVDVSAIARAQGGGGHRQAAGFSTAMGRDELVAFLREEVAQQLASPRRDATASSCTTSRPGSPRTTSSPGCAARSAARAVRRSVTRGRSTRSPPDCC